MRVWQLLLHSLLFGGFVIPEKFVICFIGKHSRKCINNLLALFRPRWQIIFCALRPKSLSFLFEETSSQLCSNSRIRFFVQRRLAFVELLDWTWFQCGVKNATITRGVLVALAES